MESPRTITDEELITQLRRAAGIWFKNTDLLLLEELIRRFYCKGSQDVEPREPPIG